MLDYLTFHYYPIFRTSSEDPTSIILDKNGKQNIPGMLEAVNVLDNHNYVNQYDEASPKGVTPKVIRRFQEWSRHYYPDVKLALTAFSIDSVDKISYHPILRPLYLADLVARVANSGVDTFIDSFLQGGSVHNDWGLIDDEQRTNLYYMYSLFSNNYLGNVAKTEDTYGDAINVYSTNNAKEINVFLVNKDAKTHFSTLSFIDEMKEKDIADVIIPPWGLTILKIPNSKDNKIRVLQYGAQEMGIKVDPYYDLDK